MHIKQQYLTIGRKCVVIDPAKYFTRVKESVAYHSVAR